MPKRNITPYIKRRVVTLLKKGWKLDNISRKYKIGYDTAEQIEKNSYAMRTSTSEGDPQTYRMCTMCDQIKLECDDNFPYYPYKGNKKYRSHCRVCHNQYIRNRRILKKNLKRKLY